MKIIMASSILRSPVTALSLIFPLIAFVAVVDGVWLTIPSSGTKCVSEEIQNNVIVLADYYVVDEAHVTGTSLISARVTSPYGNNLHHNENVTHGQFAFTTHEAGNYLACFWMDKSQGGEMTLSLDWRIGIAAKDWESVARKEKIEGVELELLKLEGAVQSIRENIVYLKHNKSYETKDNFSSFGHVRLREVEMREVSEVTNSRVAWFSIMSLGVCIVVAVLQLSYLQRYFQKKKLI